MYGTVLPTWVNPIALPKYHRLPQPRLLTLASIILSTFAVRPSILYVIGIYHHNARNVLVVKHMRMVLKSCAAYHKVLGNLSTNIPNCFLSMEMPHFAITYTRNE